MMLPGCGPGGFGRRVRAVARRVARPGRGAAGACLAFVALSTGACADAPSIMRPAGPAAERIAALWWLLLAICTAIYVVFAGLTIYAIGHRRTRPAGGSGARYVLLGGTLIPAVIVACLFMITLSALRAVAPGDERPRVVIDVDGRLWWWEIRYAGVDQAITANEIHIPVGEPVELRLHSDNVIHSFWVPRLHGKLDLVPGKTNVLRIQADAPGIYRGQCAEYCGLQHARMALLVVAQPRPEFEQWLAHQRQPALAAASPSLAAGQAAFGQHCGRCHTVRGTAAEGVEGPDLTHLAGRRTLAAGTLPNTIANLGGWIVHAQSIKPGNLMPDVALEPAEFRDVLAYLMTLR